MLSERLRSVLSLVKDEVHRFGREHESMFAAATVLRAISPLAEGTDRFFAAEAMALNYELCVPMPFVEEEYRKDFQPGRTLEPDSAARFDDLLERAGVSLTRFEMDGGRDDEAAAYGACGRVVVNQSDLLVVVWDGERQNKRGGTEETLDEARRKGVPVVWIDAHDPHSWALLRGVSNARVPAETRSTPPEGDHQSTLIDAVRQALELPLPRPTSRDQPSPRPATTIHDFYAEKQFARNYAPLWTTFRDLVGEKKWSTPDFRAPRFDTADGEEWKAANSASHARVIESLRPFYAWADNLAVAYANIYRSAFVLGYAFAGLAVGTALFPLALGWDVFEVHLSDTILVVFELLLIAAILFIVARGRRRKWHERWVDYRLTAELLRHLRLGASLGSARPFPQVPAQYGSYGDPAATWMTWYVRGFERDLGLPSARLDVAHLRASTADLATIVNGQLAYHRSNAGRSSRIEHRLHAFGLGLLYATLAACVLRLFFGLGVLETDQRWFLGLLVFLAGFLPALGATVAGISNQGEFRRVGKRSSAMLDRLDELKKAVDDAKATLEAAGPASRILPRASEDLATLAVVLAQLMVTEVLDWRVVFLDQPLKSG